jgi:dTDP-4-amino-4,6-dideoxygalactose transaminase
MMPYMLPPAETRLPWCAVAKGFLPSIADFSKTLREFLKVDKCVLANSGRALLFLLFSRLHSLKSSGAAEVLMPGYTCYSVAAAAVKAGLRVALYDLNPRTFQPDIEDVRRKINTGTLAIVGQHLLGVPADITGLTELAHQNGICCIEDSAQLLDRCDTVSVRRMPADYTVFSFGRGKPLPLGGGGALIGRELGDLPQIANELEHSPRKLSEFLTPLAVRLFAYPQLYWLPEKLPLGLARPAFDPSFPVTQMPLPFQRIGTAALASLDRFNEHRAAIGRIYHCSFGCEGESKQSLTTPPYPRYPLLVGNLSNMKRVDVYGVRQIFPRPLCDLPALQCHLTAPGTHLPGVREIADRLVTLPTHLSVNEKIADRIVRATRSVFRECETVSLAKD